MYLILAIVALVLGASVSEGDIWNLPLSQLTLHMIFSRALEWIYYGAALVLGLKSLESDRIWPWRWTQTFLYSIVVRSAVAGALVYGIIALTVQRQIDLGWELAAIVMVGGILLYFVLFSPKFEFFEKEEKHMPVEELAENVVLVDPWFPTEDHAKKHGHDGRDQEQQQSDSDREPPSSYG
jgi:hypothetical protein